MPTAPSRRIGPDFSRIFDTPLAAPGLAAALCLATLLLTYVPLDVPLLRLTVIVAVCLVGLGLALVPLLEIHDATMRVTVALASSLVLDVAIVLFLTAQGAWDAQRGLTLLIAVCLAGITVQGVRALVRAARRATWLQRAMRAAGAGRGNEIGTAAAPIDDASRHAAAALRGPTFATLLPKPVPNAHLALALAARTNWRPGPVLIADPDPVSRARLRGQLAEMGWATAEAANGIQASDLLDRARARVVLLDIGVARSCFPLLVDLHTRALRGELLIVMLDDGTAATSRAVRSLSGSNVDPDRLTAMIPPRRKTP
jgi:hypothetical protein